MNSVKFTTIFLILIMLMLISIIYLPPFLTGTAGLLLVIIAAIRWQLYGGLLAALSATAAMFAVYFFRDINLTLPDLITGSTGYFLFATIISGTQEHLLQKNRLLKQKDSELAERNKELKCLHEISGEIVKTNSITELFESTVEIIPDYLQYPEIASVRIKYDNQEFVAGFFKKAKKKHLSKLYLTEKKQATLEIAYTNEIYQGKEVFILAEEKKLMKSIVALLTEAYLGKKASEKLQKNERDLAITLRSIGDGVIATDLDGRITRMNPAAERMTGWRIDEARGVDFGSVFRIYHAENDQQGENPVSKVLASGQQTGLASDIKLVSRDGKERQIADSAAPIKDEQDNISGVIIVFSDISKQYQIRKELEKNKSLVQATLNSLNSSICVLNQQGEIVHVNQSWLDFAGDNDADMNRVTTGINYLDICEKAEGEDRQTALRFARGIREVISGEKEFFQLEYPCHSPDEKRWFVAQVTPHFAVQKDLRWVVVAHENITGRKLAEEQLAAKKKELETFFNVAPDLLCIADVEGNFLKANKAWQDTLGYSEEVLENKKFLEFVHPDDIESTLGAMEMLAKQKEVLNFVNRYRCSDGDYRYIEWRSHPQGNLIYAASRDITEHKQLEQKLKKSEEKYRSLVENVNDIVFSLDAEGNFSYVSPNWTENLGHEREEVVGRSFTEFVHPDDQEHCISFMQSLIKTGGRKNQVEYRLKTKDGEWRWHTSNASPCFDQEGRLTSYIGISHDITDRRRLENKLQYQLNFEQIVSDISSHFVKTPVPEIDASICYALESVGKFFLVDRSYIFSFSDDGQKMTNTHEWARKGIEPHGNKIKDFPLAEIPWWYQQIIKKQPVQIADVLELPEVAAAEKRLFMDKNMKSLLCMPLVIKDELYGFIGLDAVREKTDWSKNEIALLQVIAEIITGALSRQHSEINLRKLTYHDQLTGLYNRLYLEEKNQQFDKASKDLPVGLIMADVNGLKLVNDTFGHDSGDRLLQKVADILEQSCRSADVISRWGGDEFVIVFPQTEERDIEKIMERIKNEVNKSRVENLPVSVALGYAVKKDDEKIEDLFNQAEEMMYRNKIKESPGAKSKVLTVLLKTLAAKSHENEEHVQRLQKLALAVGQKAKLPESELERLSLLALLHDVGLINTPEEILSKAGILTASEFAVVKKHPATGYRIASSTEEFAHVARDILTHHEHWDGNGYPRGLAGEEIPLLARIIAISDAYEAMTNDRVYKKEVFTPQQALQELQDCSGSQFDPQLVDIFTSLVEEGSI